MKHILVILLCVGWVQQAQAQSINLFGVDATNFPTMKGKFYAFDAAGNQQRPSASELTLTENGIPRTITNVSCPPAMQKAISSVLVVDVSGSMSGGGIGLAQVATRSWVHALPLGKSECAITSFNHANYLNQDFTTDRTKLLNAINTLQPSGGTDYNVALIKPMSGGLMVTKNGKYQKVLVFLTDGQPTYEPDVNTIVAEATKQRCIIFCVTLGIPAPQSVKDIATRTGGEFYENVTTVQQATDVYNRILQVAQNILPCELTWVNTNPCEIEFNNVELSWQGQTSISGYYSPTSAIATLSVIPQFIAYGKRLPLTQHDTVITITTKNADFTIIGINRNYGSADFTIVNTFFPLNIPKNSSKSINLRFSPSDSGLQYASFEIVTDKCSGNFSAYGGFPGKKSKATTLKLTHPNGGEKFIVGSDTAITWTGIASSDFVNLEYSIDDGKYWHQLATRANNLHYVWKNIPDPPSEFCKVRIKQIGDDVTDDGKLATILFNLKGHSESVSTLQWSPDGLKVATASGDGTVIIWSATNGTILLTLYESNILVRNVTDVLWSPDGAKVATLNSDGIVDVWSSTSGAKLFTLKGHTLGINTVQWSPDGTKILTASDDKTSNIWSSVDGAKLFTLTGHTSYVLSARWSSDGGRIATASYDETAIVWDATKGTKLFTINGIIGPVRAVEWSPDGSKIATLNFDTVTVWNAITGTKSYVLSGDSQFNLVSLQWSPDGSKILTVSTLGTAVIWLATNGFKQMVLNGNPGGNSGQWSPDGSKVLIGCAGHTAIIWSAETGAKLFTLNGHTKEINTAQWSLDGSKVATASLDKTAKIWDINDTSLQEDVSDAVFSIVAPSPTSQDVDMKQCFVGTSKDSLITTFVQNAGTYPFRVDSIAIVGTDASQFQLVSGMPPYIVGASGTHAVEFRFKPTSVGVKTAQLLVYTQADTLRQTIHGEGIAPTLQVLNDIVDFGRVLVGKQRDTLQTTTIKNIGNAPLPITATRHAGPNDKDFTTLAGGGNFTLQPGEVKTMDLRFTATEIGRISGRLLFDYNGVGSPATVQLFAEGVDIVPSVTSTASVIFDSVCVGKTKTTNVVVTNNGNVPLQLLRAEWITNTGNQFSTTLSPKTLDVDSSLTVSIDYTPNVVGQSVAEVRFIADKDTAISTLSGIGKICTVKSDTARTTVSAINITAQAGEKVNLQLVLKKQSGMQLTGAPTDWYARVHYNSSVLYNTQTNNTCIGTTDSCVVELNGTYNPTQSELISVPCVVTLGNTDNASITIDEFRWTNNSITTEVVTENGTIHVTGVCDEGGVRLFMPSNVSTSLATRPNPAQNTLAIHYGLREPLNVTIELINTTGQVVQTFVQSQQQAKGEYTLNEDISTLGNGVYMLRLVTNKDVLATRVDVVK